MVRLFIGGAGVYRAAIISGALVCAATASVAARNLYSVYDASVNQTISVTATKALLAFNPSNFAISEKVPNKIAAPQIRTISVRKTPRILVKAPRKTSPVVSGVQKLLTQTVADVELPNDEPEFEEEISNEDRAQLLAVLNGTYDGIETRHLIAKGNAKAPLEVDSQNGRNAVDLLAQTDVGYPSADPAKIDTRADASPNLVVEPVRLEKQVNGAELDALTKLAQIQEEPRVIERASLYTDESRRDEPAAANPSVAETQQSVAGAEAYGPALPIGPMPLTSTAALSTQPEASTNQAALDTQSGDSTPEDAAKAMLLSSLITQLKPVAETPKWAPVQDKRSDSPKPQPEQKTVHASAVSTERALAPKIAYRGQVVEAFTGAARPISDVLVQILGTELSTRTDQFGQFSFDEAAVDGVLPVVITKEGYRARRAELRNGRALTVELVAENSAALSAWYAGEPQGSDNAFLFGQLVSITSETVEGMRVSLSGPAVAKVVYVGQDGVPNKDLTMTSRRGQFLVLNLHPGTYHLTITDALHRERAPHVVHVSRNEGLVRKFSMGSPRFIHGQVVNALLNAPVADADVRLLGSEKTVKSGKKGQFVLGPVYVDCTEPNYLQMEKSGFYRNRIDFACPRDEQDSVSLYAFAAGYVDGVSAESFTPLTKYAGVVIGHVSYPTSVKMQLWGPDELSMNAPLRGRDFYFDADGVLNRDLNRTSAIGNFAILEAPEGLSYIQAFDKNNRTLSFWPILLSPSTVNVYAQ